MEKPTVATPTPRMKALAEKRVLVNDLMGGTFRMRAAAQKWLPKHPAESEGVYKTRLEKTYLDNFLGLAIDKAKGKIFSRPLRLEDVPPALEELMEDIDLQGSGLDVFAQTVGQRSLEAGISYVLIDVPPSEGARSAAEERAAGIRPYCVHIDPDCVIEVLTERIGGVETVQRVRLLECVTEREGDWGYCTVEQVRVLEMRGGVMCYDVYRKRTDGAKVEWILQPDLSGVTTFTAIMLVPFYSNRTGFMEGEPGFQNVAESTLEHWQWKSEHAHALSMNCFGMYWAAGVNDDFEFVVGPGKALKSSDPETKFGVLETTGKGVELAAKALESIENRIETAGVQLRVENQGKVTATAAQLDSEETNAGLAAVAKSWSDSWEQVLRYMAQVLNLGEDAGGEVEICMKAGGAKGTPQGLTELGKARALGDISREAYLGALVWRGELPEEFDMEADAEKLGDEGMPNGAAGRGGQQGAQQVEE